MIKHLASAAFAATSITVTSAVAQDTTTGALNVTTSVSATCQAPNPSGNLNIPFTTDGNDWNNQVASSSVAVSVTCSGGATPDSVTFDTGNNPGTGGLTGRALVNISEDACLQYGLEASEDDSTWTTILFGDSTGDNTLSGLTSSTFYVRGTLENGSTGCSDQFPVAADPVDVPGGDYSDTITMTVSFS